MDSVLLLHLLGQLAPRCDWRLSALHVHHGISPNADAWADFCAKLCARDGIPLQIERVDITPLRQHGVEAAARKLRHDAFARQGCDFVALAHHADDQVETLLLQLLRGAGVRGVAAMPRYKPVTAEAPAMVRPLLDISRRELLACARQFGLSWIEDESNADERYPRNFLRHQILPQLEAHFPAYRQTLARSAGYFAEASGLLDELAAQDAGSGESLAGRAEGELAVANLQSLSRPRAANLLRYFLHRRGAPMPQSAQLDDMLHQLCRARPDARVCVEFGTGWQVRRYRGKVHVLRALEDFDPETALCWKGETALVWTPLQARVLFRPAAGAGISLAKLSRAPVTLRVRRGSASLRTQPGGPSRTLKNLLQEHAVPPWQRQRLPLLYCGEELVSVVGLAIAADFLAEATEVALEVVLE
jgi:tRNA(Ile)-lysidine synthase